MLENILAILIRNVPHNDPKIVENNRISPNLTFSVTFRAKSSKLGFFVLVSTQLDNKIFRYLVSGLFLFKLLCIFIEHWLLLSLKIMSLLNSLDRKYSAGQRTSCSELDQIQIST